MKHFGSRVSLCKTKSKNLNDHVWIKQVSENKKHCEQVHKVTNLYKARLLQEYKKPNSKQTTFISWKFPATGQIGKHCGLWKYVGCDNHEHKAHQGKTLVRKFKTSCKKAECPECWYSWVNRESFRSTKRFENYERVKQEHGYRKPKLIHVIFSPPWNEKFSRYDVIKKKLRELCKEAGIIGGLAVYHAFANPKSENPKDWVLRPHFHILGYGWLKPTNGKNKIDRKGWVIKNKGIREKTFGTISYLLTHCAIAKKVHSVFWFGELGYRAKYASEIRVEDDTLESKLCQFCGMMLKELIFVGSIDPPPDIEFEALLNPKYWKAVVNGS